MNMQDTKAEEAIYMATVQGAGTTGDLTAVKWY